MRKAILTATYSLLILGGANAQLDDLTDFSDSWVDSRISHFEDTVFYGETLGDLDSVSMAYFDEDDGWIEDERLVFTRTATTETMASGYMDSATDFDSLIYTFGLPPLDSFWIVGRGQYFDGVSTVSFSSIERGLRHRNNSTLIDSITSAAQYSSSEGFNSSEMSRSLFEYQGNLISKIIGSRTSTEFTEVTGDILTFSYDTDGRAIQQVEEYYFGIDTFGFVIDFNYLTPSTTSYAYSDGDDVYTLTQYRDASNQMDSLRINGISDGEPVTAVVLRTDDGSQPLFREYSFLAPDDEATRTRFYYAQLASDAKELPLASGDLRGPNPARGGASFQLNNLALGTKVMLLDMHGKQIYAAVEKAETHILTWPDLASGMYFVVIQAPGAQARAWPIISQ